MKDRPTPETDAFFRSFADGDATPSHAEYYDRMRQLERERDEARAELEQAKQDAKQHEVDCLRALGERNEAREQRDESLRLLGKWEQVAIGAGERVLELTKQREKLAQTLQSLQVACFRIGRGDVNDVGAAVEKMRQKALEALSQIKEETK